MSCDSQQSRFINLVNTIASLQREKNEAIDTAAEEKKCLQNEKLEVCLILNMINIMYIIYV